MATIEMLNPPGAPAPASRYSQGALVAGPARWLHVSGQIGMRPNGTVPDTVSEQIEVALDNLEAVLAAADMTLANVVKLDAFLTDAGDVAVWRTLRDRRLQGHVPAATLLVVAGLVTPALKVEIQAVAAGA